MTEKSPAPPSSTTDDAQPGKGNFEHAMSLLTMMSTSTQLFVGLTGAAWAVLIPNTMALPTWVVIAALSLHVLLSVVMFAAVLGLGANMAHRLNLSRWQETYPKKQFPGVKNLGFLAWFGIPKEPIENVTPRLFSFA